MDFANKAFELLDHLGWDMAGQVLPSLVHGMARARRSQELSQWRDPIDIASMVWEAREQLPGLLEQGRNHSGKWDDDASLASAMLADSPGEIMAAIKEAIAGGATAAQLGSAVSHAAFLRMAHFHTSNEFRDWDTVHNTLTGANALHQALKRTPTPELMRGVFDAAMSIYLDRFLNMPPQRLPDAGSSANSASNSATEQLDRMLEMVDSPAAGRGIRPGSVRLPGRRWQTGSPDGHHGVDDVARGRQLPLFPDRRCGVQTVRGATRHGVRATRDDRIVQVPSGPLPHAPCRGPDLPDSSPATAR